MSHLVLFAVGLFESTSVHFQPGHITSSKLWLLPCGNLLLPLLRLRSLRASSRISHYRTILDDGSVPLSFYVAKYTLTTLRILGSFSSSIPCTFYNFCCRMCGKNYCPRDFTFVCPTEILAFNDSLPDFAQFNTSVLGMGYAF